MPYNWTQTNLNFASLAEARAYYLKRGWVTVDEASDSYIMCNYKNEDGKRIKTGEVIINRNGFMDIVAEQLGE